MVRFMDENLARKKEEELQKELDKISKQLIKGGDGSIEALYQLQEMLEQSEMFDLHSKIKPKLVSTMWVVKNLCTT